MSDLFLATNVLSAMITPAVLISACGTLILATSQRIGRVIERTRKLTDKIEGLLQSTTEAAREQVTMWHEFLDWQARRALLLQKAMVSLYLALATFVATSVSIGIMAVISRDVAWLPVAFGLVGALLLLRGTLFLIQESQLALASVRAEGRQVSRLIEKLTGAQNTRLPSL